MYKIYDETLVDNLIKDVAKKELTLDEITKSLENVFNKEDYLTTPNKNLTKDLYVLNTQFDSFLTNTKNAYSGFVKEVGENVVDKLFSGDDSVEAWSLNDYLKYCTTVAQDDPYWQTEEGGKLTYKPGNNGHAKLVYENGCGPSSITNQLITGFGVTDKETVTLLYKEVLDLTEEKGLNWVRSIHDPNKFKNYPTIQKLISEYDGNIISADGDVNKYLADYTFDITKPTMIVGKAKISTEKDGKNTNDPLVELMKTLHNKGVDANVIFSGISSGRDTMSRPVRGGSDGHYVSLFINSNEFIQENSFYLVDSQPKNLFGEELFNHDYAFTLNSEKKTFEKFNNNWEAFRVSNNTVKFQRTTLDSNGTLEPLNGKNFSSFGFFGSANVIITFDPNKSVNLRRLYREPLTKLDGTIASFIPKYETTSEQDLLKSNLKADALNPTTSPIKEETVTEPIVEDVIIDEDISENSSNINPEVIVESIVEQKKEDIPLVVEVDTEKTNLNKTINDIIKDIKIKINNLNNNNIHDSITGIVGALKEITNEENQKEKPPKIFKPQKHDSPYISLDDLTTTLDDFIKKNTNITIDANSVINIKGINHTYNYVIELYLQKSGLSNYVKSMSLNSNNISLKLNDGRNINFTNNLPLDKFTEYLLENFQNNAI